MRGSINSRKISTIMRSSVMIIAICTVGSISAQTYAVFRNGGFEEPDSTAWQTYSSHRRPIVVTLCGRVMPASGSRLACLMAREHGERSAAFQRVQLPPKVPLFLNHQVLGYSEERCDVPQFDRVSVRVGSEIVFENARVCRDNPSDSRWRWASFDISRFAGKSVLIGFEVSTIDTGATLFALDNFSVSASPMSAPLNWRAR